jgi:hypothetical protein
MRVSNYSGLHTVCPLSGDTLLRLACYLGHRWQLLTLSVPCGQGFCLQAGTTSPFPDNLPALQFSPVFPRPPGDAREVISAREYLARSIRPPEYGRNASKRIPYSALCESVESRACTFAWQRVKFYSNKSKQAELRSLGRCLGLDWWAVPSSWTKAPPRSQGWV